jgi:hypothetical protein
LLVKIRFRRERDEALATISPRRPARLADREAELLPVPYLNAPHAR